MSDIAIRAKNLGKRYGLGQREPYKTLRDVMTDAIYRRLSDGGENKIFRSRNLHSEIQNRITSGT